MGMLLGNHTDAEEGRIPEPIDGKTMTIIAIIALVVNSTLMFVLGHDHGHDHGHHDHHAHHNHDHHDHHDEEKGEGNLNLKAAYIHVLGDFVQSLGVLAAG